MCVGVYVCVCESECVCDSESEWGRQRGLIADILASEGQTQQDKRQMLKLWIMKEQ